MLAGNFESSGSLRRHNETPTYKFPPERCFPCRSVAASFSQALRWPLVRWLLEPSESEADTLGLLLSRLAPSRAATWSPSATRIYRNSSHGTFTKTDEVEAIAVAEFAEGRAFQRHPGERSARRLTTLEN